MNKLINVFVCVQCCSLPHSSQLGFTPKQLCAFLARSSPPQRDWLPTVLGLGCRNHKETCTHVQAGCRPFHGLMFPVVGQDGQQKNRGVFLTSLLPLIDLGDFFATTTLSVALKCQKEKTLMECSISCFGLPAHSFVWLVTLLRVWLVSECEVGCFVVLRPRARVPL